MRSRGFSPIWLVLVVAIIGVVAVIFLRLSNVGKVGQTKIPTAQIEDQQIRDLQNLRPSDEVEAIEFDLSSTNVESLDQGLSEAVQAAGL